MKYDASRRDGQARLDGTNGLSPTSSGFADIKCNYVLDVASERRMAQSILHASRRRPRDQTRPVAAEK